MPFFGPQPSWFDFFILSCSKNPKIDWLFISDQLKPVNPYPNIKFSYMTLGMFNVLASEKLDLLIRVHNPYKICDLRPAFGIIFSDLLQPYEYWGYGDLDVIYGNFQKLLPYEEIKNYDIISSDSNFIPGHLCILKNSPDVNLLFRDSPRYKKIFQSKNYYGFDEFISPVKVSQNPYLFELTKKLRMLYHISNESVFRLIRRTYLYTLYKTKWHYSGNKNKEPHLNDFNSIIHTRYLQNSLKVRYKKMYDCDLAFHKTRIKNWQITWSDGTLVNNNTNQELLYFHFILSKQSDKFVISEMLSDKHEFNIVADGIKN